MAYYYTTGSFTIGLTYATPIILNEKTLCGMIITASTITGSLVSFMGSRDGINYYPIMDNLSAEVNLVVSASPRAFSLHPEDFFPYNYIKTRLGTSGSEVTQKTYNTPVEFIIRDI